MFSNALVWILLSKLGRYDPVLAHLKAYLGLLELPLFLEQQPESLKIFMQQNKQPVVHILNERKFLEKAIIGFVFDFDKFLEHFDRHRCVLLLHRCLEHVTTNHLVWLHVHVLHLVV